MRLLFVGITGRRDHLYYYMRSPVSTSLESSRSCLVSYTFCNTCLFLLHEVVLHRAVLSNCPSLLPAFVNKSLIRNQKQKARQTQGSSLSASEPPETKGFFPLLPFLQLHNLEPATDLNTAANSLFPACCLLVDTSESRSPEDENFALCPTAPLARTFCGPQKSHCLARSCQTPD